MKSLTILQSVNKAWSEWKQWLTVSGAMELIAHNGPCGLVQCALESVSHTREISTHISKLSELATKLNQLSQQAQSEGHAVLETLVKTTAELQMEVDKQNRWTGPDWNKANATKLSRTPLSVGLLASQLIVRGAHSQWSSGFDDVGLAEQRVRTRMASLESFMSDREQLVARLDQIEKDLNLLEPRFALPKDIVQVTGIWAGGAVEQSCFEQKMPHWPCSIESVVSASLDGQLKLLVEVRQLKKDIQVGETKLVSFLPCFGQLFRGIINLSNMHLLLEIKLPSVHKVILVNQVSASPFGYFLACNRFSSHDKRMML